MFLRCLRERRSVMAKETIGDRIRRHREQRGMTASTLARLANVTPTAVWNWENNGTEPRANALAAVAKAFGISREALASGNENAGIWEDDDVPALTVDDVLKHAQSQIAKLNGVPAERVKVSFRVGTE